MDDQSQISAWLEQAGRDPVMIHGTCSIGRSPNNQVVLADVKVSRRHAVIHVQDQHEFWLVDLGSSNGTYVDGRRVTQPIQLRNRNQIEIADFRLLFRQTLADPATELEPSVSEKTIQEIKSLKCWLLVADIISSTHLVRRLSPDELPQVTGHWFSACKEIIDDCGGSINKFLGDGFFAYWPAREKTVSELVQALAELKKIQALGQTNFRVVLHYGQVFMGGSASLGEESLMGQEVNFVFRMEKLAAALHESCLLSEPAQAQLKAHLPAVESGRHALTGFEDQFLFFSF